VVAASLPSATCAVSLCVCKWLRHNWSSCPVGAREPKSICVSIPRADRLSPVLFPLAKASSPRSTIFGHAIGLISGYAAFVVTGAGALPFGVHEGIFWPRILAAALSLSITGAFMVLLDVSHPPAGATTLIVSLGIISKPRELLIIEVAVFLLVAQALIINRLAGLPYPMWNRCSINQVNEDWDSGTHESKSPRSS
jgi:hypothetical protein